MPLESAEFEYVAEIAPNHPSANGHFIGNPIIPGAVILEYVRIAFERFKSHARLQSIIKAKHLRVLRPGHSLVVRIRERGADRYSFSCLDDDGNEVTAGDFRAALVRNAEA